MSVTIKDIAEKLGVHHTTVSRVLNNKSNGFISEATKKKVKDAAKTMGYRPNRAAKALVTGSSKMAAIWVCNYYLSYGARALRHLKDELSNSKYDIHIVEAPGNISDVPVKLSFTSWPVDGIVAMDIPNLVEACLKQNIIPDIPIVNAGFYYSTQIDHVGVDINYGAKKITEHLIDSGRKRIAYLGFERGYKESTEPRISAYNSVMSDFGLKPEYITLHSDSLYDERQNARREVKEYISRNGLPEAIFCYNDEAALGVYRGLIDLGITVPDDVALAGCDGIEDTLYLEVPITTIVQPTEKMCQLACEFLQNRIENPDIELQSEVLIPEISIRESSGGITRSSDISKQITIKGNQY